MSFVLTCSWHFLKFWQNLYFHNAAIPYLEKGNARDWVSGCTGKTMSKGGEPGTVHWVER